jgi:hypothetical protein
MSQLLSLGAINKLTCQYVSAKNANRKDKYICPDCGDDLILCQGEIRIPYYRHEADRVNPCNYYSKPTESQIHKDAKMLMKTLLEKKTPLQFIRECVSCKIISEINLPEITEGSIITIEHRFNYDDKLRIADVAHTVNGEIKGIYEICNTHKTCSENRPEPWVEIDANSLLTLFNTNNEPLIINCIRCEKCKECMVKELVKELIEDKFSFITNVGALVKIGGFLEKNKNNIVIHKLLKRDCNMKFHNDKLIEVDKESGNLIGINCKNNFNEDEINIINKYNIKNLEDYVRSSIGYDKSSVLSAYKELNKQHEKIINYAENNNYDFPIETNLLGIHLIVRFDTHLFRIRLCKDKNRTIKYIESYGLICEICQGSGTSYWSDDYYGSCLECCCINCRKFHYDCECKYCKKCESSYMKDEEHKCYLCEKCGNYEQYESSLQDHCKECCNCNKITKKMFLRNNGKCGPCYDGSKL